MRTSFLGLTLVASTVLASPGPQPAAQPPAVPAAKDTPYPGTMKIFVDTTDTAHHIYRVREEIPVTAGDVTLFYPRWIPGAHAPEGTIDRFAGLTITAGGRRLEWKRDVADVFAFHVTAPAGTLVVEYQYLSPVGRFVGPPEIGRELLVLDWPQVTLYPAGYFTRQIPVEPSVKVPDGWKIATALDQSSPGKFKVTTLETLLDCPIHAGHYYQRYDLTPAGDKTPVFLDLMADRPEALALKPDVVALEKKLIEQTYKLFGAKHYDHYDFLFSLSEELEGYSTIEHHRGAEYVDQIDTFADWEHTTPWRDTFAHEYVHSWDGKWRRPADLWTADLNSAPMRNSLLWVYEGGTEYLASVLTARAGLWTKQIALDEFAMYVAREQQSVGRTWRPLQDTTNDEIVNPRRPMSWPAYQRFEDYYVEGALIWLDADTLIREKTGNKKSLDDFARAFFGDHDRDYTPLVYTFDDVVATLNGVYAYDWKTFLRTRLDQIGKLPLDGITRGGYKLEFTAEPSEHWKNMEAVRLKGVDHSYSLGIAIDKEAIVGFVAWDSPAAKAGIVAGMKLLAVNGLQFDPGRLLKALNAKQPIELILQKGEVYVTKKIDYRGGPRYPHLVRDTSHPALLDDILAPKI
jgi:predicted metalloprotease with PDZ domain